MRPQPGLTELVRRNGLRACSERAVRAEDTRRQSFEQNGLVGGNAQMPKAALGVCHRERERSRRSAGIVILPREGLGRLAIRRHASHETQSYRRARWKPDPLAEADDRIQHDARRAGEGAPVECLRVPWTSPAAQKAGAIRLPFERPLWSAFQAQGMERPGSGLVRVTGPSMAQQSGAVRQILGFNEQLAECRVSEVVHRGCEDDLGIARHIELADAGPMIAKGDPPHLDVIFGRDCDLEPRRDIAVAPPKAGPVGAKT